MKISFDIDGVITDTFIWGVYTDYVIHEKTKLSFEEFWLKENSKEHNLEQDNWMKTDIYYSHKNITPEDHKTLWKLYELGHEIYYITSRPVEVRLTTINWFKRNDLPFRSNVIFNKEKALVIDSLGIMLHVEDNIKYVEQTKNVCKTLIKDMFYNREYNEVPRIKKLEEVLSYV